MDILKQFDGKINDTLETFTQMICQWNEPLWRRTENLQFFIAYMVQRPLLLGKIHNELRQFKELSMGIGENKKSYHHSYELAEQEGETDILIDLEIWLKIVQKIRDWKFDVQKQTYYNSLHPSVHTFCKKFLDILRGVCQYPKAHSF